MKHQWDIGRHYGGYGHRIVAEVRDNSAELAQDTTGLAKSIAGPKSWIAFSDLSRGIDGAIPLGHYLTGRDIDPYTLEKLVMANYDLCNYGGSGITLTWEEK